MRPRVLIDLAEAADTAAVWSVFGVSHADLPGTRPTGDQPMATDLVARLHGRVVGFAQLVRHPAERAPVVGHWSFSLGVHPLLRGMGVGSALLAASVDLAAAEGAECISALVYEDNQRSLSTYAKAGFGVVDDPAFGEAQDEERRSTGHCRLVLRRDLT
jgi:ribosomal protein S18 acetylase RimI-like enzyme